jgi:predicted O-methyltransferase YrrM
MTLQSGRRRALLVAKDSSVELLRYGRTRFLCDVLTWSYRDEFASIWAIVDQIPGWFNQITAAVLYEVARAEPPNTIVEIGSYLGRSTVFFGLTLKQLNPSGRVVAVDPHTGDRQHLEALSVSELPSYSLFQAHCRAARVDDLVDARVATSLEAAESWSAPVDLLYVDGWHSYDAVVADGRAWLPWLSDGGVVLFDDYARYDEVRRAVEDLAAEGLFHLWGPVFGQAIGGRQPAATRAAARALRLSGGGRLTQWIRSTRPGPR